ncbi:cysteine-rich CWC family protein [Candidatus Nitrospira bockiana]
MRGPIEKRCEHCGQAFLCGQYGCWCNAVSVTEAQYEWIAVRYRECLCPTCLGNVSRGVLGPPPTQDSQT